MGEVLPAGERELGKGLAVKTSWVEAAWPLFFSGEQVRGDTQRLAPESHDGSKV